MKRNWSKKFTKDKLQEAIESTSTLTAAARKLHMNYQTFKKYSKQYGIWPVYVSTGRPTKGYSEFEIKNAIDESRSFMEAARYLNTSYLTFKKYAESYGLWIEGGLNPHAKGIAKPRLHGTKRNIDTILDGSKNGTNRNLTKLREWIIREARLAEQCDMCGFSERRVTDLKMPLILTFNDGDKTNYKLENLRLLCWNCAFLTEGNVIGRKKNYFSDGNSGDVYDQLDV